MGHYVYQYLHPIYGHLYCGRTCNLHKRIYEHNNCKNDNIPNEYKSLLRESVIMYIELSNKAQEIAVEAYCIDKFKPFLNKALNYSNDECCEESIIDMKLPQWKIYTLEELNCGYVLYTSIEEQEKLSEEQGKLSKDIAEMKNSIKHQKEILSKQALELERINYEILSRNHIKIDNGFLGLTFSDIKWYFKHCDNHKVKFISEIYDRVGKMTGRGTVNYDNDKQSMILNIYKEPDFSESFTLNQKDILLDLYGTTLYNFYPDINIYPELYSRLSHQKSELIIKNSPNDLQSLFHKYNEGCSDSIDGKIRVWFEDKGLTRCVVFDTSKTSNCFEERYSWDHDDHDCGKGKKIDPNILEYIFSSKYYSPECDLKEEEYVDKMLSKMSSMVKAA